MEQSEDKLRQQILVTCQRLHARNMLAAADGNVSFRLNNERILITPSGEMKAFMKPDEIAVINLVGDVIAGRPSGERLMHLEVYRQCPQAKAIVHAHPPNAIAWSLARPELHELPSDLMPEVILAAGRIPIVPYARPGSAEMGTHLRPFLPQCRLMILSRHGALAWGEDLDEAYRGMERLEHSAEILRLAFSLGAPQALPEEELTALRNMREQMGAKTL